MTHLLLASTLALTLAGCGSIQPGGAGRPVPAARRPLPVTSADVLSAVSGSFDVVSRERNWGRHVEMRTDPTGNTLTLAGPTGAPSDSLSLVAFRSSSDKRDVSEANLPVLRALVQRVAADPGATGWFDEWSASCCTQPNEVVRTFGFVRTTLSFTPLLGVGVTFSVVGDELRH
jgi:hypothetical protein